MPTRCAARSSPPACRCSGVLHRDDGIVAPSRHLGLVPAAERDDAAHALDRLADRIAQAVDLEQIVRLAQRGTGPR